MTLPGVQARPRQEEERPLEVGHGQREAAAALGIPRVRRLFRIILPQAMRTIVPTAGNEIIGLGNEAIPASQINPPGLPRQTA
ncbi:ABC transporter permease subunit [Nonomuraea sp. M3C6]|uniref:ABC transporter permease subunit n=1 Tax=Nonomuraea marmarensis TaxID=3351344 RepID=A0ABW7AHR4_9ACTN